MPTGRLVRTVPDDTRKAIDPNRLTSFCDSGTFSCGASTRARSALKPQTSYDPSLSWDGMSVNPKPFSKLDMKPLVGGSKSAPMAVTGSQVVILDTEPLGGIYESVSKPGPGLAAVPHTMEQRDVVDAQGKVPQDTHTAALGLVDDPKFMNMGIKDPVFSAMERPSALAADGTLRKHLISPAERKQILDYEACTGKANKMAKTAELQRRRLVQLLKARHPDGAIGVDGILNVESGVYGDDARVYHNTHQRIAEHRQGRRDRLDQLLTSQRNHGFDPFGHSDQLTSTAMCDTTRAGTGRSHAKALEDGGVRFLQAKSGRHAQVDTQGRLFGSCQGEANPKRSQELRNQDLAGKNYNIVTHAKANMPPTNTERRPDYKWMSHPSQHSLEATRSLQGAVPLGDRSSGYRML